MTTNSTNITDSFSIPANLDDYYIPFTNHKITDCVIMLACLSCRGVDIRGVLEEHPETCRYCNSPGVMSLCTIVPGLAGERAFMGAAFVLKYMELGGNNEA